MSSQALEQMSTSQRAAIAQKLLSGSYTAHALLDDLRAFANFDELNEAARRSARNLMIGSIVGFVVTLWIGLAAVPELLPLALALLGSAIYFGLRMRKLKGFDVSDNVRKVALPFLAVLKQDIAPDEPLQIHLDLAVPTDERKRIGSSPSYALGAYDKIIDTHYRDPWFEGSARLVDGSLVRWRVLDEIRESKRSKTNARGKRKTKIRHAKHSVIDVSVSLPVKAYRVDALNVPPMAGRKVTLERADKRCTIKLTRKLKRKSLAPIEPNLLIDSVSLAYRCATPIKESAA